MQVCVCKAVIHSSELWLRQCKGAVQAWMKPWQILAAWGLAPGLAPEGIVLECRELERFCAGPCAGPRAGPCAGGTCAGGPQAGLWKNDRNQPAGFRVVVFRSRWQIQAERPQPSEDTIPPRLRNKGSVSSGSAFLAARASISACSIIKFFSLV